MPYANKEDANANARQRYADKHDQYRAMKKAWENRNREKVNARHRKETMALKIEVLSHYGPSGNLQCCFCDVIDIDMLTLDHVNDDGKHRAKAM
jgi:hypothetical protein